uniref:Locustamyotropin-3 n=1 Tax=Locusta migratoria TaxID=7004 RepID=LMT3_LOCMI|nr:RecName: Full=Locustamyotropin-3; AltName: Full=Lom-MT-3 [Locusta migratoria]prf//1913346A locustamyotropin III [Locusta migratoria]
RQQPFVPRL